MSEFRDMTLVSAEQAVKTLFNEPFNAERKKVLAVIAGDAEEQIIFTRMLRRAFLIYGEGEWFYRDREKKFRIHGTVGKSNELGVYVASHFHRLTDKMKSELVLLGRADMDTKI